MTKIFDKVYGSRLREAREAKNMSMEDVVFEIYNRFKIKSSKQNYSRYEVDDKVKRPDYLYLEKIYEVLDLDISVLPHRKNEKASSNDKYKELYEQEKEKNAILSQRQIELLEKLFALSEKK